MFPRAFFAGRYFAPRFFPESRGEQPVEQEPGRVVCLAGADRSATTFSGADRSVTTFTASGDC